MWVVVAAVCAVYAGRQWVRWRAGTPGGVAEVSAVGAR